MSTWNYFVLKALQDWICTTLPDVLSSLEKLKPLFKGSLLLKKIVKRDKHYHSLRVRE